MKPLKKLNLVRLFFLLMMIIPLSGLQVGADDRFFSLSEIRPGIKGQGYTVLSGTKIESFPVEVVGLLRGNSSVRHLILVKVSGRLLQKGGGISAGMSGSPVFFRGRLAGAIGYGFQNADPGYALVTPVEEMLKLWEKDNIPDEKYEFYQGKMNGVDGVSFENTKTGGGNWLYAKPVATPLFITGLGHRAYEYLTAYFPHENTRPVYSEIGTEPKTEERIALDPGSAVSVTVVDGAYQVSALGTLTWVDENRFLAFGHPFLNKGRVCYGFGGAYIHDVVSSTVFPFKIGSAFLPSGRVTQDRGAGIAGELGILPEFINVSVKVKDSDLKSEEEYTFRVINDETLLPGLVLAGIMDAEDRTLDRIGPGTAFVHFSINGSNISPIERENIHFGQDVAASSLRELARLLQMLTENEFSAVDLTNISMEVEVTSKRLSARLIKAETPKNEFLPGEKFTLIGKLLPYRGTEVQVPLEIELPGDISAGKWLLSVRGSGFDTSTVEEENNQDIPVEPEDPFLDTVTSLDQLIADFLTQPANNKLVVEAFPLHQNGAMGGSEAEFYGETENATEEIKSWSVETEYYLTGEEQIIIDIKSPEAPEEPAEEDYEKELPEDENNKEDMDYV